MREIKRTLCSLSEIYDPCSVTVALPPPTGFQVTGMMEWRQKSKPPKSLGLLVKSISPITRRTGFTNHRSPMAVLNRDQRTKIHTPGSPRMVYRNTYLSQYAVENVLVVCFQ